MAEQAGGYINRNDVKTDIPQFTGINRLYGDGSVVWRKANEYNPFKMKNPGAYPYGYIGYHGGDGLPFGFY